MRIRCRENGPLVVAMPVEVVDHLGNPFPIAPEKNLSLYVAVGPAKKTLCDGAHKGIGFIGAEVAPVEPTPKPQ